MLYALVFITRYLNILWISPSESTLAVWNFVLKNFYIISSFYILFLMMRVYARTREREKAWRLGAYCLIGSVILAPVITIISEHTLRRRFFKVLWSFSIVLESVCVVPQLLLLRQTTVPTVIDSFYLLTLGSYRAFYILNWIVRLAAEEHHFEWRAVVFGIIQTAFYVDFAWVYWTRQRVKLRNGGIVDSTDLSRGFLVSRVLGQVDSGMDDEERAGLDVGSDNPSAPVPRKAGSWGVRGVSVSADDGLMDLSGENESSKPYGDGLADLVEDDDAEDDVAGRNRNGHVGGHEWR